MGLREVVLLISSLLSGENGLSILVTDVRTDFSPESIIPPFLQV